MNSLLLLSIVLTLAYTYGDGPRMFTNGHAGFQFYHANKHESKANNISPNLVLGDDSAEDEDVDFADSITRKQYAAPPERHKSNNADNLNKDSVKHNMESVETFNAVRETNLINKVESLEVGNDDKPIESNKRNITIIKHKTSNLKPTVGNNKVETLELGNNDKPNETNRRYITISNYRKSQLKPTNDNSKVESEEVGNVDKPNETNRRRITVLKHTKSNLKPATDTNVVESIINDDKSINQTTSTSSNDANEILLSNDGTFGNSERILESQKDNKRRNPVMNISERYKQIYRRHKPFDDIKSNITNTNTNEKSVIVKKDVQSHLGNYGSEISHKLPNINRHNFLNRYKNKIQTRSEITTEKVHEDIVIATAYGDNITNSQIYMITKDSNKPSILNSNNVGPQQQTEIKNKEHTTETSTTTDMYVGSQSVNNIIEAKLNNSHAIKVSSIEKHELTSSSDKHTERTKNPSNLHAQNQSINNIIETKFNNSYTTKQIQDASIKHELTSSSIISMEQTKKPTILDGRIQSINDIKLNNMHSIKDMPGTSFNSELTTKNLISTEQTKDPKYAIQQTSVKNTFNTNNVATDQTKKSINELQQISIENKFTTDIRANVGSTERTNKLTKEVQQSSIENSSTERTKESLTASTNNQIEIWKRPQTSSFSRRRLPYKNSNHTTVAPSKHEHKIHTTTKRRFKGYSRKPSYTRKPSSVTTTTQPSDVLKKPINRYNSFNRTNKFKVKMNSRNMTSIGKAAITRSPSLNLYMRKPSDKFMQMHKINMSSNVTTTSERSARPQRHLSIPYLFYRRKLRS